MKLLKKAYVYLIFIFLYAPIVILAIYSFNDSRLRNWNGWTFKWYIELFQDRSIMQALLNTLIIAGISSIVATVIGTFAALGIYYMKSKWKTGIMNMTYIPVLNPDIVTGVSLMLLFLFMHIPTGFATLVLAHITFSIPYVILSIMPKLDQLNPHLFEAAEDLCAGWFYTFRKVIFPEIKPGVISGLLLAITLSIDDFVVSFFTSGSGVSTLSVEIYAMAKKSISPTVNALSTIMFAAVLTLLIIINTRDKKALE